jgi:hypothetical protein
MITNAKTNKKYLFRQMQPGDTFRLNIEDVRSAQKMVIARGDDGYHCQRID